MRWFVLDNGILSYYKSQDEVNQGCKGSLKVSACEIIVHSNDHTRLEISIPGEQHMYLKASSKQERQQWLVALGSSKACMTTRSRKDMDQGSGDSLKSKKFELKLYCDLLMQQVHQVKTCVNEHNRIDTSKLDEATSLLTVTCDTFITTLDECMKLADANFLFMLSHHPTDNPIPLGCHQKGKPGVMPVMKRSSSYESSEVKSLEKKT
ncbi:hypothetical protein RUM44_007834 [Polyplax serrata]|uniref:PH domain-containing protein n=1 Tax=Polyplax serrata TaxID=468196 RepID=A0ABR1BAL9_POLSC